MTLSAPLTLWVRLQRWRHQLTVPQFTAVTGLLVIASGTVILASPLCSTDAVGLWQALFTVTSAITVTGLSVIVVERDLTPFGQIVLAGLIVTGGLGLMAITTFLQGFVQGAPGCATGSTRAAPSMNSAWGASAPPSTASCSRASA